jgi:hypothetical protein
MIGVVRYWKPIVLALVIAVVCTAWRIDRASQYRDGKAAATAHISATLSEVHGKQAVAVLEQERQAAAALSAEQAKIEKERQHAKTVIAGLRGELGRLQQYAENQRGRTNLPATAEAAAASDGKTAANGWALFGKCAAEYAGMAEVADEQRNDLAEWQAYGRVAELTSSPP